jgi:hypothetical protein
MICNDDPCVHAEPVLFYSITETIKHDLFIELPAENILPSNNRKGNEMKNGRIAGLILRRHKDVFRKKAVFCKNQTQSG